MAVNYFKSLSWFNIIQFHRFSSWHWLNFSVYLSQSMNISKYKQSQTFKNCSSQNSKALSLQGEESGNPVSRWFPTWSSSFFIQSSFPWKFHSPTWLNNQWRCRKLWQQRRYKIFFKLIKLFPFYLFSIHIHINFQAAT